MVGNSELSFFTITTSLAAFSQRTVQLGLQIIQVLHTDTQPHQVVCDAQLLAALTWNRGMSHDGRVVHKALHAAEGFGNREQLAVLHHATGSLESALHPD